MQLTFLQRMGNIMLSPLSRATFLNFSGIPDREYVHLMKAEFPGATIASEDVFTHVLVDVTQ